MMKQGEVCSIPPLYSRCFEGFILFCVLCFEFTVHLLTVICREIYTPMMLGCMFALDREFFFKIGTFDTQMEIWGAENLEISFRVILP